MLPNEALECGCAALAAPVVATWPMKAQTAQVAWVLSVCSRWQISEADHAPRQFYAKQMRLGGLHAQHL
jgi:hypothetical protein